MADESIADDLVLLVQAIGASLGDRLLADVRASAPGTVRYGDGYVFQHLTSGPVPVTILAEHLGVSQQAASKQVAEMERRGLVRRVTDPADRRSRPVELTEAGWAMIHAGRAARHRIATELADDLGDDTMATLQQLLRQVSTHLGAVEAMSGRRIKPERHR